MARVKETKRTMLIAAIAIGIILVVSFVVYLIWSNNTFGVTHYTHKMDALKGLRILQISDLHNKQFGASNAQLKAKIAEEQPDYIFLTGDIIEDAKVSIATDLLAACVDVAPTFYVSGNHEGDCGAGVFEAFKTEIADLGVQYIDNTVHTIDYNGTEIAIVGIGDANLYTTSDSTAYMSDICTSLKEKAGDLYTIALSHRPDFMDEYAKAGFDFVFTGHVHGGQWRLGRLGAYSKSQGLFPRYSAGLYTVDNTTMLVNRGLGNSAKGVPRIFNQPEITVVEFVD